MNGAMDAIERRIKEIYAAAQRLYEEVLHDLGDAASGYEILYGPPMCKPWMLLIGDQPGGGQGNPLPGDGIPLWPPTVTQ